MNHTSALDSLNIRALRAVLKDDRSMVGLYRGQVVRVPPWENRIHILGDRYWLHIFVDVHFKPYKWADRLFNGTVTNEELAEIAECLVSQYWEEAAS